METFLSEVARRLREEHPHNLDQVTVIFNNRRSGLFLRRQFASMEGQPFFLPRIIGIDELVSEIGNLTIVPNEYLLFELFDIHRTLATSEDKYSCFEDFISFGDMMLSDFSEIDLYCVDAHQLFNNLHNIKAIEKWNVETGKPTPFQEKYLAFYQSLYQYYTLLHQRLLNNHRAYSGMAYRHLAEKIDTLIPNNDGRFYYFVGFNALSTCEERIIRHYMQLGNGKYITDGDAYYFDDPSQEAGFFLRRNPFHHESFPEHFAIENKNITIVTCPENVLQCKYAGQKLAQMAQTHSENPLEQTAIVLADESLLVPMLNALPQEVKTANVTMGYPFSNTAIHSLVLKLFSLHQRRRENLFYHADILGILTDDNISPILGINNIHSNLTHLLTKQHIIYASPDEISDICKQLDCDPSLILFLFCVEPPSPDAFLSLLKTLVHTLYDTHSFDHNHKEKESLACLLQIVDYFQELQKHYHFVDNLNTLQKIYTRIAQRNTVPFYGEPLQGLQILGVLETRNLDFNRVILLSANEGSLPSAKSHSTLIPYDLKVSFGIPTFHEKEAVYAYNFYRLLQRASDIHLVYHTESEGMGQGEPSRFLLQVRSELASRYPNNIALHEEILFSDSQTAPSPSQPSFPKNDLVLCQLEIIAKRGFSPSALNKYRNCPVRFYYENILNIKENNPVSDDLEQSELGSCIHAVLEKIYTPTIGAPISTETLKQALLDVDRHLAEVLELQFHHGRSHIGRNHFLESVAKMQITNFLKSEINNLEKGDSLQIIALEKELSHPIQVSIDGTTHQVLIAGTADRIDLWNGYTRIIDYKSGKVEPKDLIVKEPEPNWAKVSDKWFQVMVYTWLSHYTLKADETYLSGIYPLGHLQSKLLVAQWEGSTLLSPNHLSSFEELLQQLISDILNPAIPFLANYESSTCAYCPFSEICQCTS